MTFTIRSALAYDLALLLFRPHTTTPAGRMVLTVFAGIADFERSLIVERTSAGRIAAKARGVRFGPSPALSAEQIAHARQLIHDDKKGSFAGGGEILR